MRGVATRRGAGSAARRGRALRLTGHEARRILALAGPIVLSQLGTVGMNTTDTLMVGPLGATALAAAGLGAAIHMFLVVVSSGTVMGMLPLVSQAFGAGEEGTCRKVLIQGLWLAVALSVPVGLISLEGEAIALALGQEGTVAALAGGYMMALAPGVPAALLFTAFRQYLEGMGKPLPATVLTLAALVLNVFLNYAFIYGVEGWIPAMGVVGSGWATTGVRWFMLLGMVAYVVAHPRLRPFRDGGVRPRPAVIRQITVLGAPIGAQGGLEVGLFSLAAVMMGWIGPAQLAAHQVTINLASTTFMVALGVGMAGSIRVGQHIGARRPRAARRAAAGTYLMALGFMGMCALLFVSAPGTLIGLYTGDPEILAIGATLLLVAAAFQLFDGAQVAGATILRGAADTYIPMLVAAFGYWCIGIPASYVLGFHTRLGAVGVWVGLCIGLAVVALLLAWRVRQVLWGAWPAGGKPPMLFRRTRRRAGAGDPATASSGAGPLVTDADAVPALGPDSGVAAARVALPGEGIGRRRIEPVPGTDPCSTTC
ncbi:MAG TPA: MATE family efflux transporter [Longimicrobiales bacterium]|mgnify:CR=1 FL=1|nr:MATE family efflux transporter [Longimicrobiales bacterium]